MKTLSRQRTMFLGMLGVLSLFVLSCIAPAGAQAPAPDPVDESDRLLAGKYGAPGVIAVMRHTA